MIRLGGGGVTPSDDPWQFARNHVDFGYRAAYCPPVELADKDKVKAIREAFAAVDVQIAEIPIWRSMLATDDVVRKANRDFARERLALADEIGGLCAITYVGSMGSADADSYEPHPDNLTQKGFDAFVEAARDVIDSVKPKRAKLCFEMMQWQLPDSPEVLVELIKAIDRPGFAAHLDPCNLVVSPRNYYDTSSLIRKCFELVGPWIISAHAKDITLRYKLSLHLDEVILGTGNIDYRTYLSLLDGRGIPIMLEHLEHGQFPTARDYIKGVGKSINVDL